MKNCLIFVFKSIFFQKKLLKSINSENILDLQRKKIKYIKEFEEKLRFLEYEQLKVISNNIFPTLAVMESIPFSKECMNENVSVNYLRSNKYKAYSTISYVDVPLDYIKNELSHLLAKELVNKGFVQTKIEDGLIKMFVNVYEK